MYLHATISATSNHLLLKNLVVFASGSGSNFQSLIDAVSEGKLEANIVGLISNNDSAYAIERANNNGIQTFIISPIYFNRGRFVFEVLSPSRKRLDKDNNKKKSLWNYRILQSF